jgi:predicted membrane-bound spermidine synthase
VLPAVFFVSGFCGLLYEVVFAKSLALAFGSTATAATTVLATYMGGMALGSWLGGRLRTQNPLRAYAMCELGIAVVCAASPWTVAAVRGLYVLIAAGHEPGAAALLALRVALGSLALLPPTVAMGATLPLLTRAVRGETGATVGLLYAANTLGAAAGACATGYLVLPYFGVRATIAIAVFLNLAVATIAFFLRARPAPEPAQEGGVNRRAVAAGLLVLGVGGAVTFALETTYAHLLAVVAGNSAYAFSLMLFAFLIGLSLGAAVGRRMSLPLPHALVLCELGLACCVLAGVFLWDQLPGWFVSLASSPLARGFARRELVRFIVCCVALVPPAACIGALFPLAISAVANGSREPARAVGVGAAVNTVGNVLGALGGGFALLPRLGSLHALQALAAVAVAIAAAVFALLKPPPRRLLLPAAALLLLAVLQPASFNLDRLASGANVYFHLDLSVGKVIDSAESLDGGLTTIHLAEDGIHTLRTNGKFQGSDGSEVAAQAGFALDALLHQPRRGRALVIGFGTGMSTRLIAQAGFAHVDLADLSADILRLSDEYFARVNGGVLRKPNLSTHITDGRNFLLLSRERYDLIGIELTSIWFAGAASLYNREFYRLVAAHLEPHGVLQQWVQLHHIRLADIATILASARAELPHVWLYVTGGQGILIACREECLPGPEALEALERSLGPVVAGFGGVEKLVSRRILDPAGVERFITRFGVPGRLYSTDDNLLLEYSTPRGNAASITIESTVAAIRQLAQPKDAQHGSGSPP